MIALPALVCLLLAAPAPDAEALYQEALYRQKILGDVVAAEALLERAAAPEGPVAVRARATIQRVVCLRALERVEEAATLLEALLEDGDLVAVPGVRDRAVEIRPLVLKEAELRILKRREEEGAAGLQERIEELERELRAEKERVATPPPPATDGDADRMRRLREEKLREQKEAERLLARAREYERQGEMRLALLALREAVQNDPENVAIQSALQAVRGTFAGRGRPTDDPGSALAYEREIRHRLVPREVEKLFANGRRLFLAGDYQKAADLFGAVLQLRLENPDLAVAIVEQVTAAREYLERAAEHGARPSFSGWDPGAQEPRDWLRNLFEALEGVRTDDDAEIRFYPLARMLADGGPDVAALSGGAIRIGRPEAYPAEALSELVKHRIAPGTWDDESRFVKVVEGGRLVVRQDPAIQRRVEGLLATISGTRAVWGPAAFDVVVFSPTELRRVTQALATTFREHGAVAAAVLDASRRAAWSAQTRKSRRIGRAAADAARAGPVRLDATRTRRATIGYSEGVVAGGLSVRIPKLRLVREGLRLDVVALAPEDGIAILGVQGEVSLLSGPVAVRSTDAQDLRWVTELGRTFSLAENVPTDGALLVIGLASPFAPRRESDVVAVLIAPAGGGDSDPGAGAAATDGVRLEDLAPAEDVEGPTFDMERIWGGPTRPHSAFELIREELGGRGLEILEREGHLLASGQRADDARTVLRAMLDRRDALLEIRARAVPSPAETGEPGAAVRLEPEGRLRAWRAAAEPALEGDDRLKVGRFTAAQLQRVQLSRVESRSFVRDFVPAGDSGGAARPLLGTVRHGLVLDVRAMAVPGGDDVLVSVLVKAARLDGLDEVELPLGRGDAPLVVSSPRQVIRRARALVRLAPGQRLILDDLPDPFGVPDETLRVEITVRRR